MNNQMVKNIIFIFTIFLIAGCSTANLETKAVDYLNFNEKNFAIIKNNKDKSSKDSVLANTDECNDNILKKYKAVNTKLLIESKTDAFLIYQNKKIICYFLGNSKEHNQLFDSWSVAKSITSVLIGIAIQEGYIHSVNDPITNYLPDLSKLDKRFNNISILNLLEMRSGLDFDENYFKNNGDIENLLNAKHISDLLNYKKIKYESNLKFNYSSYDYQLLGLILEKSTNKKLADFASDFLWKKIDANAPAYWLMDSLQANTRAYCCIKATLGDYFRFALLVLNKGKVENNSIVTSDWMTLSTDRPNPKNYFKYGLGWWHFNNIERGTLQKPSDQGINSYIENGKIYTAGKGFGAEGVMGQFIFIYPDTETIIIRFGRSRSDLNWQKIFLSISESK
jgi:CubicO group peptidase (beta-lactamase class C family)